MITKFSFHHTCDETRGGIMDYAMISTDEPHRNHEIAKILVDRAVLLVVDDDTPPNFEMDYASGYEDVAVIYLPRDVAEEGERRIMEYVIRWAEGKGGIGYSSLGDVCFSFRRGNTGGMFVFIADATTYVAMAGMGDLEETFNLDDLVGVESWYFCEENSGDSFLYSVKEEFEDLFYLMQGEGLLDDQVNLGEEDDE